MWTISVISSDNDMKNNFTCSNCKAEPQQKANDLRWEIRYYSNFKRHAFFISDAFFQLSLSVA